MSLRSRKHPKGMNAFSLSGPVVHRILNFVAKDADYFKAQTSNGHAFVRPTEHPGKPFLLAL
jgi:hypothetical protein